MVSKGKPNKPSKSVEELYAEIKKLFFIDLLLILISLFILRQFLVYASIVLLSFYLMYRVSKYREVEKKWTIILILSETFGIVSIAYFVEFLKGLVSY